jgi:hypothetical protein
MQETESLKIMGTVVKGTEMDREGGEEGQEI